MYATGLGVPSDAVKALMTHTCEAPTCQRTQGPRRVTGVTDLYFTSLPVWRSPLTSTTRSVEGLMPKAPKTMSEKVMGSLPLSSPVYSLPAES